jgi:hypothetical protein
MLAIGLTLLWSVAAIASPRDILADAAFQARSKPAALVQIDQALAAASAALARNPRDRDAALTRAMAMGYRAKLKHDRGDALAARRQFEILVASDPKDPEAAAAIGTWHVDSVNELGGMLAGLALGAKKAVGLAELDRAVALGGNRAMFPALAALLRITLDPEDPRARALAERSVYAAAPEPLDRLMQKSAAAALALLRAGDRKGAQKLAKQSLPFGRID